MLTNPFHHIDIDLPDNAIVVTQSAPSDQIGSDQRIIFH